VKLRCKVERVDADMDYRADGMRVQLTLLAERDENGKIPVELQPVMMAAQQFGYIDLEVPDQEVREKVPFNERPLAMRDVETEGVEARTW